ncbi:MAG TPA: hypothetical protein PKA83_19700 [Pirellulaceae bacterium]|nr:hypothetical protein [Pirellulaceae bacterium]
MFAGVFRFSLDRRVSLDDAEMTLHLAMLAAEGLYGSPRVAMEFRYELHALENAIDVDGETEVGTSVARIFAGLLLRQFGEGGFRIDNIESACCQPHEVAA